MKDLESFGRKVKNVDEDEWGQILSAKAGNGLLFQVQDLDDRFKYGVEIKGKPYLSTFHVYAGVREEDERRAFDQVVHTQRTGWFPILNAQGNGWQCAYCSALAPNPSVCSLPCPCRAEA